MARRVAAFYLGVATLMMLSLFWVYWTVEADNGHLLGVSSDRVVTGVVFVCGVGIVHLVAVLLDGARGESGRP
jgi:hypothetical protein